MAARYASWLGKYPGYNIGGGIAFAPTLNMGEGIGGWSMPIWSRITLMLAAMAAGSADAV